MAFPGMRERLEQEVRTLAPDSMQVAIMMLMLDKGMVGKGLNNLRRYSVANAIFVTDRSKYQKYCLS